MFGDVLLLVKISLLVKEDVNVLYAVVVVDCSMSAIRINDMLHNFIVSMFERKIYDDKRIPSTATFLVLC